MRRPGQASSSLHAHLSRLCISVPTSPFNPQHLACDAIRKAANHKTSELALTARAQRPQTTPLKQPSLASLLPECVHVRLPFNSSAVVSPSWTVRNETGSATVSCWLISYFKPLELVLTLLRKLSLFLSTFKSGYHPISSLPGILLFRYG